MVKDANSFFRVIEGGEAKKPRRRRASDIGYMWKCPHDGLSILTKVKIGAFVKNGRIILGEDGYVCAACLAKGKITQVT